MANTKSAQKQARKNVKRRAINLSRNSALKKTIKKVLTALESQRPAQEVDTLFRQAQAQIIRARGKGLLHANSAARRVSRLAARVKASEATK